MATFMEALGFVLLAALGVICSKSDLEAGVVRNKVLAAFFAIAIAYDFVYYGFFASDLFALFLGNFALVSAASLIMFYSHSFAGGDCKMAIVMAALYPAGCCLTIWGTSATLVLSLALSLASGYCFLLVGSARAIAKKKASFTLGYVKESARNYLRVYVAAVSYISFVGCCAAYLGAYGFETGVWIVRGICLVVALCVGKLPKLRKPIMFIPAACLTLMFSVATGTAPISLSLENCLIVLALLFCQMVIKTSIYERVAVEDLKKGMILSALSSIAMQASVTKGLPGVSTEDLRSRLSEEEAESIKIWARATRTETLAVVRKIPFAAFVSVGFLLYGVLWGASLWA